MESYKFLQAAETAKVFKMRFSSVFVVDKAKTPELYEATLNDEYKLPFGVMIVLKDGEETQSAIGDGESVFSQSIGFESAGGSSEVFVEDLVDASDLGKELLQVGSEAEARAAIGAGVSNLEIGTSSTTAKAGDYQPTWEQVSGKPAVIGAGATAAAARTAIGAGTSSLTLAQSQAGIATKPAIAALTEESTLEEVIAALKA